MSAEPHSLKLKIMIKKISMTIKFPCSLTFQLKIDQKIEQHNRLHQLRNNQCILNEQLQIDFEANYNTQKMRYEDKKLIINIFMISNSGKISAGTTVFNPFSKEINSMNQSVNFLDKCPDKQAKIYFNFCYQLNRNRSDRLDRTIINQLKFNEKRYSKDFTGQGKREKNYLNIPISYTQRVRTQQTEERRQGHLGKYSPYDPDTPSRKFINQSQVQQIITYPKSIENTYKNKSFKTEIIQNRSQSKSQGRQKRPNLPTLQSLYMPNQLNKDYDKNRQKFQVQNEQLQEEIVKLKERIKNMQRKEKSQNQAIKQLKQELEKRRSKLSQIESGRQQLEQINKVYEEKLKRMEKNFKQISEKHDQLVHNIKSIKNSSEMRQNSLKQQQKKIEEKYRQSEIEKERMSQQGSQSLKNIQEMQKKCQQMLRQKDKLYQEEKIKLNKKIEQLNQALEQMDRQIRQQKQTNQDITRQKKQLEKMISDLEIVIVTHEGNGQSQQLQLKKYQDLLKQTEKQLESYKIIQNQKIALKKKNTEMNLTLNSQNEKILKLQKQIESLQAKIKEIEEELQKKITQKNQFQSKFNSLKKQYDSCKVQSEQQSKQIENLNNQLAASTTKINDVKYKLQLERKNYEDMQRELQMKLTYSQKYKQQLQSQSQDLKWHFQKQSHSLQELGSQLKLSNQQIFKLNQQLIQRQEKIKKQQELIKTLTLTTDHLTLNLQQSEGKKREQGSSLKDRNNELFDLKKKLQKNEEQLYFGKEKIKSLEALLKDKTNELQKKIKDKDSLIKELQQNVVKNEEVIKNLTDEAQSSKQNNLMLGTEINHLKGISSGTKKQIDNLQLVIVRLKESQLQLNRQLSDRKIILEKREKQIQELKKNNHKSAEELVNYKTNCNSILQGFLLELMKEEDSIIFNSQKNDTNFYQTNPMKAVAYPEEKISKLQIQLIEKRNQQLFKQRAKFTQMKEQQNLFETELNRLKITVAELQYQHQQDIFRERQHHKSIEHKLIEKDEALKDCISKYEEQLFLRLSQIQNLKIELGKTKQQSHQLSLQCQTLIVQFDSFKLENRQLEQKFLQLKSQQIKQKSMMESKYKQIEQSYETSLQKIKESLIQAEKKISLLQKQCNQKCETNKKWEIDNNSLNYQKQKRQHKIRELEEKLQLRQLQVKQLTKEIKDKQKDLKKHIEKIDQLNLNLSQEKDRYEELSYKSAQQNHLIIEINKQVENYKQNNRSNQQKTMEMENLWKNKFEYLKTSNEKLLLEIKSLKQKIIQINSELELKIFVIKQLENSQKIDKDNYNDLKAELNKKKDQIYKLNESLEEQKKKGRELEEKWRTSQYEKGMCESNYEKLKSTTNSLKMNLKDQARLNDQISVLMRQVEHEKSEKQSLESHYLQQISQLKHMIREGKRLESSRTGREQDLKRRIKSLQKTLQSGNYDFAQERKKLISELDKEKKQLMLKLEAAQDARQQSIEELQMTVKKYKKQLQRALNNTNDATQDLYAKEFMIKNQQQEIDNLQYRIHEAINEKSKIESQLERERQKNKKISADLDLETRNGRQKLKKANDQIKILAEQLQQKILNSKQKRLQGNLNELQKSMILSIYRTIEENIQDVCKDHANS